MLHLLDSYPIFCQYNEIPFNWNQLINQNLLTVVLISGLYLCPSPLLWSFFFSLSQTFQQQLSSKMLCFLLFNREIKYSWGKSLMVTWLEQAWHEVYCHDLEVMNSIPSWVELGVCSSSVLSRTWIKSAGYEKLNSQLFVLVQSLALLMLYSVVFSPLFPQIFPTAFCPYFTVSNLHMMKIEEHFLPTTHAERSWGLWVIFLTVHCISVRAFVEKK